MLHITVTGLVQGVGFRPFVAGLAEELAVSGEVKNAGGIVEITAAGEEEALEQFVRRLRLSAPEGALVREVIVEQISPAYDADRQKEGGIPACGFRIADSACAEEELRLIPPDLAVCAECEKELKDPANRRYRHPFISCTACGPRYSVMHRVPYDRQTITMERFPMCGACRAEYGQKGNRRRHAQTIACHACGPYLRAFTLCGAGSGQPEGAEATDGAGSGQPEGAEMPDGAGSGQPEGAEVPDGAGSGQPEGAEATDGGIREQIGEAAFRDAAACIRGGGIAAVKDIGGFHFAFLADNEEAAMRLRVFKHRERKPFAVLFPNLASVRRYCLVSEEEAELLSSNPRPIVLLDKKKEFAPSVCAGSDRIGAMLPCNPLQILLAEELGPLVMTSGNRGGEPILIRDEDMLALLHEGCPDLVLTHDREIITPLEDSVCQVTAVGVSLLRRGRGYVPEPIGLPRSLPEDTFAAGGDLKAVFALGKKNEAYLSAPFGDLEEYRCEEARRSSMLHMEELLAVRPVRMAADMHPAYRSAQEMQNYHPAEQSATPVLEDHPADRSGRFRRFQHHHAHILSVMAEHGLAGPLLGVAFDGTGYGGEGQIWGGEFLFCRRDEMERVGSLYPVILAGGDAAAKDAVRSLWCYLLTAKERGLLNEEALERARYLPALAGRSSLCNTVEAARRANVNCFVCSSMGRLFDAVSALLGICTYNSYEGECAVRLEQEAVRAQSGTAGQEETSAQSGTAGQEETSAQSGTAGQEEMCAQSGTAGQESGAIVSYCGLPAIDGVRLLAELFLALERGVRPQELALFFHRSVVGAVRRMCKVLAASYHVTEIALSGGSFANRILLDETAAGLRADGFFVYRNEAVPCGDGGLALGQLYGMTYEES